MLGIESKIADAQWNQMYAHSPPPHTHRPAALPPHPNQRQRAKNNPKKRNAQKLLICNGIKCTPHTAVSPSPQNQRGIKNNFLVLLNSKIPSPFSALQP